MKKNSKLEFHIPLILSLMMLFAATIPMLNLPYCCSETELLSDQIIYMKDHGLGPVFNGNAVELPNLFSVICYFVFKYLTINHLYIHIGAMILSIISVLTAYKFGKFFFSVQAGVMSAAIVCVQEVFMAQSGLLLPCMFLNVSVLTGLHFYFREKYFWCMLAMCVATLTDITGLAASIYILFSYLKIKYKEWHSSQNIMLAIPVLLWVAYEMTSIMICSKFSLRISELSIDNLIKNLYFTFIAQYRFVMTIILAVIGIKALISKNMLYFIKDMAKTSLGIFASIFIVNSLVSNSESWNLVPITILSIFAGCAISTLPISYYNKYIIACVIMSISVLGGLNRAKTGDAYLNYKTRIINDLSTVRVIENTIDEGSTMKCNKYFQSLLNNKLLGYSQDCKFYDFDHQSDCQWLIISNFDDSNNFQDTTNYTKMITVKFGGCKNIIWQKNPNE